MHISRTTTVATSGLIAIGAVLAADVAAPAPSAQAAEQRSAALTARVSAIQHQTGRVTLTGTAEPNVSVFVGGGVEQAASVRAGADGTWSAEVRVGLGEHTLQVATDRDWRPLEVPVTVLEVRSPVLLVGIGSPYQEAHVLGTAWPRANVVVKVDGQKVGVAKADGTGAFEYRVRGLVFGERRISVTQRFDGTDNGTTEQRRLVEGVPAVTTSVVDVDEQRIRLAGTAPAGTVVRFRHEDGSPVMGADGAPVVAEVAANEAWSALLPLPSGDERLYALTAVTFDGDTEVGSEQASVVIPIPITAIAEPVGAQRVRLSGAGEPGATVSFTHENGAPLRDEDGAPITATVGTGDWTKTLDARGLTGARLAAVQTPDGRVVGRTTVTLP
jgi:hypothetical protein